MSKPVEIEFLMKDGVSPGLDRVDRRAVELRGTIALLGSQLEELRLAGETASPDLDQSRNVAAIETLEKQVESLKRKLKEVEEVAETTRVVSDDLPEAGRKFNGLHNSIQQIAREMPSLAMGPQMFFLAISNNLPVFTDELKRAKDEYNDLVKAGKKGTPVWKQVLGSLFSWQTAMTTGIMLLVMYGDEIWDWTKSLFSAKKAVDAFNISVEEMNELEKDGRAQMVKTRFELDTVIASLKAFTGSKEEEKAKVEELNRKYGESFGYYDTVAQWYDVLIQKSGDYIHMLFLQQKAQAMVNKAVEADAELNKIKSQKLEEAGSAMGWFGRMGMYLAQSEMAKSGQGFDAQAAIEEYNQTEYDKLLKAAEAKKQGYLDEAAALTKQAAEIGKATDIGDHIKPTHTKPKTPKDPAAVERRLGEELLELERENQRAYIALKEEGKAKKLAQIDQEYNERMAEIAKLEAKWQEAQKGTLTDQQTDTLKEARNLAGQDKAKGELALETEAAEATEESMNEYLRKWGTFQQKKDAITAQYGKRKSAAATEGERMSLQKELEEALGSVDMAKLKEEINWEMIFGDLDEVSKESLEKVKGQLEAFRESEEYKTMGIDQKKIVDEALNDIESNLTDKGGLLGDLPDHLRELAKAQEEVTRAQEEYDEALKSGTDEQREAAKKKLNAAQQKEQNAETDVKQSADKATDNLLAVSDALVTLGSTAEMSLGELGGVAENLIGAFSEAGSKIGGIVGAIFSVLGAVSEQGLAGFVGNVLDSVAGAVGGILGFKMGNGKETQDRTDRLVDSNGHLADVIGKATDAMEKYNGMKGVEAYKEAVRAQQASNENYRLILDNQQRYWKRGSHSNAKKFNMGGQDLLDIENLLGIDLKDGRWDSFKELTAEQMALIRSERVDLWNKMKDQGDYDQGQYFEDYADQAGKIEELTGQISDNLLGVSFEDMRDSFIDSLMDMENGTEDFTHDFERKMTKALLRMKIGDTLDAEIEAWHKKWGGRLQEGVSEDEIARIYADAKEEWKAIIEAGIAKRDELFEMTGYDPDGSGGTTQHGKAGGFTAMTQDQGTKLEGMFTSGLNHWSSMDDHLESVSEQMDLAEGHLAKIEEYTGIGAGHLGEIKEDLKKMIRDGLKMK